MKCHWGLVACRTISGMALCLLAILPVCAQVEILEGQHVAEIRVLDEYGKPVTTHLPTIAIATGQPFNIEAERQSLKQLYRTGDFSDVRTEVSSTPDGLRVDFIVTRNYFNNLVLLDGLKGPPSEALALAALRLQLGETYRDSAMREAISRLQTTLTEDGLYQAKIKAVPAPFPETRQMNILVHVDQGPRAKIGTIQIRNQTSYPDAELLRRSKLATGKDVTAVRLERAGSRLRKYLTHAGYLGARVIVRRGDYDPKTNQLPLTLDMTAGPRVRIEVTGAKIRGSLLKKLLPMYSEGAVDEDLLQEGRRNLRDQLERGGYFDARVQFTTRNDPQKREQVITYEIERGSKHKLLKVQFDGNKYFSDSLLAGRISIQPAAFASPGRYSERLLKSDEDSIRGLYLANGFRDAKVQSEALDDFQGKSGDLLVRFHITEGVQTRVVGLRIEGNKAIDDATLLGVIGSTPGQPYSDFDVTSDRNNILALYYNEGFPDASFVAQVTDTDVPNRVRLTYTITERTQIRIQRVLLTGFQHTRIRTIAREVQMAPGEPLREGDVVESQRRLYNLGIFNRVAIAPQNPNGEDPDKNVVVETDEAKRITLSYGGGFEVQRLGGAGASPVGGSLSASPRGIFEIAEGNLGGRAQSLAFKVRASTLQYRSLLSFTSPNFLNNPRFNVVLTGFADKSRDVRTFTSTRYEGSFQLNQVVSRATTMIYRYSYRHVLVDASSLQIPIEEVPLFSQPARISSFGVTWVRDRRNNPGDASRGNFNTIDSSLAATSLGSSASFGRIFVQNSTYHPFGRAFVFARSIRFGVEETLGDTTTIDIPLPERFFAGGGTTLRGFGLNQAGPRDLSSGFPIGGLAMLILNQEVRFPMHLPIVGTRLGGAVFYDLGNVYTDLQHVTLRWSPATNDNSMNYLSHTVGFGFRYATPIGPVRLDLGYQLNPARFNFTDSNGLLQNSRLPHFQFFFNIGSIF
ncbi:MAG: POTRA domain-containing protein [Candidatus Acidiferrales bacterium]